VSIEAGRDSWNTSAPKPLGAVALFM